MWIDMQISQEGGKPWTPAVPVEQLRDLVKTSIDRLGGQPDLLLVHSPNAIESGRMREFWGVLEDLKDSGKLTADLGARCFPSQQCRYTHKRTGISNFRPQDIRELLSFAKHKPVVHRASAPVPLSPFAP
jgi:diketogulonate reductase-like aldo/keto reductase